MNVTPQTSLPMHGSVPTGEKLTPPSELRSICCVRLAQTTWGWDSQNENDPTPPPDVPVGTAFQDSPPSVVRNTPPDTPASATPADVGSNDTSYTCSDDRPALADTQDRPASVLRKIPGSAPVRAARSARSPLDGSKRMALRTFQPPPTECAVQLSPPSVERRTSRLDRSARSTTSSLLGDTAIAWNFASGSSPTSTRFQVSPRSSERNTPCLYGRQYIRSGFVRAWTKASTRAPSGPRLSQDSAGADVARARNKTTSHRQDRCRRTVSSADLRTARTEHDRCDVRADAALPIRGKDPTTQAGHIGGLQQDVSHGTKLPA